MAGNNCEDGICQVHQTFERALLAAVTSGTDQVKAVLETQFRDLNRRIDESMADRLSLHRRLDEQSSKLAAVTATVEAMLREGHPLRRADDPAPEAEDEAKAEQSWLRRNWWAVVLAAIAGERILTELPKAIKLIVGGTP